MKRFVDVLYKFRSKEPNQEWVMARVIIECGPKDSPKTVFEQECARYGCEWTYVSSEEIELK